MDGERERKSFTHWRRLARTETNYFLGICPIPPVFFSEAEFLNIAEQYKALQSPSWHNQMFWKPAPGCPDDVGMLLLLLLGIYAIKNLALLFAQTQDTTRFFKGNIWVSISFLPDATAALFFSISVLLFNLSRKRRKSALKQIPLRSELSYTLLPFFGGWWTKCSWLVMQPYFWVSVKRICFMSHILLPMSYKNVYRSDFGFNFGLIF